MNALRQRPMLTVILFLYLVLGIGYSVITPVFEASDEISHYPLVQHLATNGLRLPVLDVENPGLWRQEGGQPPLYYFLTALATSSIDTSDFAQAYQLNPHGDLGIVPPDGNINMVMHDPARETFPWTGTILAVHVARLLSLLMGAVTIVTTYLIGRELMPDVPLVAVTAAGLNAGVPMFLFVSGSVNNDNLSNMLSGLLVWQVIRLARHQTLPETRTLIGLGVLAGTALLAKLSLGFLLVLVAGALVMISVRQRNWRPVVVGGLISGGVTIALAGWWYLRNWQLYGDVTGLNVFLDVVGRRTVRADTAQLLTEVESFLRSWWGVFGAMNVLLPDAVYFLLNGLGLLGLIGFGAYLVVWLAGRVPRGWGADRTALLVVVIWPLVAFASLISWTSITWASQGRLLFIAIGPLSCWLTIGLGWWLPRRIRAGVLVAVVVILVMIAGLAPFGVILPAYALPPLDDPLLAAPSDSAYSFFEPGNDAPSLRLLGYEVLQENVQPGAGLDLQLYWEVAEPPSRRWSLFVHVLDGSGTIAAQRDRYPGRGLLATERLATGQTWIEPVTIILPDSLYAPDSLRLAVGWYDRVTGERMLLGPGDESLVILNEALPVSPVDPDASVSNSMAANFENQVWLRGYEFSARRVAPGEPLTVTLYWEGQYPLNRDYTVFVHVLDIPTLAIYAGSDAQPAGWTRPTTSWEPGEVIVDTHTLTLSPETPPGTYDVEVGLYWMPQEGVFERLNVLAQRRGELANNLVYLSRIAVVEDASGAESD